MTVLHTAHRRYRKVLYAMYDAVEYRHCKVVDKKLHKAKQAPIPGSSAFTAIPPSVAAPVVFVAIYCASVLEVAVYCTSDTPAAEKARAIFQKTEDALEAAAEKKRKCKELDEITRSSAVVASSDSLVQITIEAAFEPGSKAHADAAVARFLYAEGVPFVKTQSPYFRCL